jgi:glycine cleavage system H lipoate-binding protein
MIPHDFLTLHTAKTVEYLIAVSYLLLFIPFWRFVNARPKPDAAAAAVARPAAATQWFTLPEGLFYHPGHAWLRVEGPDTVAVGVDEFVGKLVGAPSAFRLPRVGAAVVQGEPAWSLVVDGRSIDMLSPVEGTVVAVNDAIAESPSLAHQQPYADGWLLKVRSAKVASSLKQLLTGRLARRWIEDVAERLHGDLTPALGRVSEDGGVLVDGLARVLQPDTWDDVARRFLLTEQRADSAAGAPASQGGHHA